ncbi:Uncharacterised protein [Neisseria zoodegmatis]|uniref:Uncharacterized protein n=1 Tax=Neisseria zoodegmatis TaxID=326523 RepID=A0A378WGJ1_9NEIS|nr:hypothetical protein [Neisseria zoodegmatis]SUA36429.1 Uncharacterised protein [Neisseria zoodegmatis]
MKKLSLRIKGEFQHSFIYSGILFLIDFNKKLSAYKWEDLLSNSINKFDNESKSAYLHFFSKKKNDNNLDINLDTINNLDVISEDNLKKYQCDKQIDINSYPTEIDIKNNALFFSSEKGLLKINFNWSKIDKYRSTIKFSDKQATLLFGDCKVFNFSQSATNRILLCMGKNGLSDSKFQDDKLKVNEPNTSKIWLDSQFFQDGQNNYCALLSDGVNIQSVIDDETTKYLKILNRLRRIKENKNMECSELEKFIQNAKKELQKKIIASNYSILKNEFYTLKHDFKTEAKYSYLRERKVNQLNTNFIQLDDNLYFQNKNGTELCKLADGFIDWRVFPNATSHFNHCHIIYEDYIEIMGFDKTSPP